MTFLQTRSLLCILAIMLFSFSLSARQKDLRVERLTVSDGLAGNSVNFVLQDYLGFLWIGAIGGLHKYDGYTFEIYKHSPEDSGSISNNNIYSLYEDNQRRLWVGTGKGLSRFLRTSNRFKNYMLPANSERDWAPRVQQIFEDDTGNIYGRFTNRRVFQVGAAADTLINKNVFKQVMAPITDQIMEHLGDGIYKTRITFPAWTFGDTLRYKFVVQRADRTVLWEYEPEPESGAGFGTRVLELKGGEIVVSTVDFHNLNDPPSPASVIDHVPRKSQQLETEIEFTVNTAGINPPVAPGDIVHVRGNMLPLSWYGNSYSRIQGRRFSFVERPGGKIWVSSVIEGDRWLGDDVFPDRIKTIQRQSGAIRKYRIANDFTNQLFNDRNNLMWVGTKSNGLYKIDPDGSRFSHFQFSDLSQSGRLQTILEDAKGNIWLGGELGGVIRLNRFTGKRHFFAGRILAFDQDSLTSPTIQQIFADQDGVVWITSLLSSLHRFNSESESFKIYTIGTSYVLGGMLDDKKGNLWIGGSELNDRDLMLYRFNKDNERYEHFNEFEENAAWYYRGLITDIVEDDAGIFWMAAGTAGLLSFNRSTGLLKGYKKTSDDTKIVNSILFDEQGRLWYGTQADGLFQFDRESGSDIQVSVADGLLHEAVMGIEADNQGNLWISSQRGLSCYNPDKKTFRHYFKSDGLQDNEFHRGAHFKSRSGELFFGGTNGFNAFYPDSIRERSYIPPVVFTDFKIHSKDARIGPDESLQKDISIADKINLAHHQNDFAITFAALDFRSPERNLYSFMLENYDTDWRPAGNERTAYYTNLDPGEYHFRVKGAGADGVWNETGAAVRIIITPPWWQTSWAYLLYGIMIAGLLIGWRRYDLKRQQLRHQVELKEVESRQLKELDHLKSRFFANISHELRTPLTLMIGPLEQMLNDRFKGNTKEQYRLMLRNGRRLLTLINQLLDIARLESGRITLQAAEGDVVDFLRKVSAAFESLAARKEIDFSFQAPEKPLLIYFDRDKLEKIVINLLSNAFKFTEAGGMVSLQLSVISDQLSVISDQLSGSNDQFVGEKMITDNCLLITVRDSGIGIPAERLPHIFDRFYQVDDTHTRAQEGSGIGLALAKELVKLHHGEILAESTPGKGSTFTVRLPLGRGHLKPHEISEFGIRNSELNNLSEMANPESQNKQVSKEDRLASGVGKQRTTNNEQRILIVEDNADMRAYLRENLAECYKVLEAVNGEEGLKQGIKQMPDLIISDVMMPKMDGYELCHKLKNDARTSHIPVILLTARADAESKIEGLESGADDYLAKPFDVRELRVRAKNLIEQRRKLWDKFSQGQTITLQELPLTSLDAQFLERAVAIVEAHLDDAGFDTESFGKELGLSRSQLHRKLSALTGQSTHQFIRTLRLKRAAQLLEHHTGNVSEIAYQVGFNSLSHFARVFREMYGVSPSFYANKRSK